MLEHNLGKHHTVFAPLLHTSMHLASQIKAVLASISIFKELQKAVSRFVTCVVNGRVVSNGNINLQDAQKSIYITSFYLIEESQPSGLFKLFLFMGNH